MAYTPRNLDLLRPGLVATSGLPGSNHNDLYSSATCHVASGGNLNSSETDDGSPGVIHVYFKLRKNLDNQALRVKCLAYTTSGTGTIRVEDSTGGADYATGSATATPGWVDIDLALTGSDAERVIVIRLQAPTGQTIHLSSFSAYLLPATPAAGALASGFYKWTASNMGAADAPIPTRWAQRILNGPIAIAKDRPACIWSLVQDSLSQNMSTSSTSSTILVSGMVFFPDPGPRDYGLSCLVFKSSGGATVQCDVFVAGKTFSFTSDGWSDGTIANLSTGKKTGDWLPVQVAIKRTGGSGRVSVSTLQIWRA